MHSQAAGRRRIPARAGRGYFFSPRQKRFAHPRKKTWPLLMAGEAELFSL